jgi:peptidoglycan-associated lipoprotein
MFAQPLSHLQTYGMFMLTRTLNLLAIGFFLLSFSLTAQTETTDPSATLDSRTQRTLTEARAKFKALNFMEAATLFQEVLNAYPNYFDVAYKIGRCYYYMRNTEEEVNWYNNAINIDASVNDTVYYDLGHALMRQGKYADARSTFNTYIQKHTTEDQYRQHGQTCIESCDFAISQANRPPDYRFTLLTGENLNTDGTNLNPVPYILRGDTFMIYTSHNVANRGKKLYQRLGEEFSDLWIAHAVNDSTFENAETMGKRVNTKANDGSACVSPDGLTIYYTICNKGKLKKKYGCSIYMSEFNPEAKTWGRRQIVESLNGTREVQVNSRGKVKKVATYDAWPTLSPDGNTLYFVSDRDGGMGAADIWYSTRAGAAWSTPLHAGNVINTPFQENAPSIGDDGTTIYFASDGHAGYGGYDIFRAKGRLAAYDSVSNMGLNLNSSWDDQQVNWLYQDSVGYIASNRPGGLGRFDIYRVEFIFRPPLSITVIGVVRDIDTREPVPFPIIILTEHLEDGTIIPVDTFQADQSGAYRFVLEEEKDYCMTANAPEYFANDTCVSTKKARERVLANQLASVLRDNKYVVDLNQDVDILLKAIKIDEIIVLNNVYFDFDSSNVRSDAESELRRLAQILKDNPQITIQMGAHTDTNGGERYNKSLSDRRAASVVKWLSENGIEAARLTSMGYGESDPLIYPELSANDEQSNRRVEFRVKSIDYVPAPLREGRPR